MNATAIQLRSLVILLIIGAGMSLRIHAQGSLGTFLGAVRGASAVIPAVKVTVVNEANQFTRTAVTDSNGDYRFEALDPATYSISAEFAIPVQFQSENIRLWRFLKLQRGVRQDRLRRRPPPDTERRYNLFVRDPVGDRFSRRICSPVE